MVQRCAARRSKGLAKSSVISMLHFEYSDDIFASGGKRGRLVATGGRLARAAQRGSFAARDARLPWKACSPCSNADPSLAFLGRFRR